MKTNTVKGFKVFTPDFKSKENGFQYSENTEFKHNGKIEICRSGFHFCTNAADCFSYYSFHSANIVCEVEGRGEIQTHPDDSKICTDILFVGKILTWDEVLKVANQGKENTGYANSGYSNSGRKNSGYRNSGDSNSGNSNSGNWNSGDRNSGYSNSGDSNSGGKNSGNRNSGNSNSGNWNSGNRNSGYRNSGNLNSGDRNSGDSNSGYRNSGAFCLDNNPKIWLFDAPTNINVRDWENSKPVQIMGNLEPVIFVPMSIMTEKEKQDNPKYETTEGYLKTITLKEAWANLWGNLSKEDKQAFIDLPNFDAAKFESITGIKI